MARIFQRRCYTQGQYDGKFREYFYFINHEGMLFLEDSRMKNFTSAYKGIRRIFLNFFYKKLRFNETKRFEEFPYISHCGRERNYLKCDDRPIVYTQLSEDRKSLRVGQSDIFHEFQPSRLFMKESGRLYHPAPFADFALLRDKLGDQLHPRFEFDAHGFPVKFRHWNGHLVELERVRK
ncbi:unnamed protein product [Caenorhabditis auriculariae]|uniref:Uncharacterized protein n=1 Tax=Caenorhabditis auriculariae TaxID=2777116 RepID=A0A8S1GQR4_9PELO|nr:unnamed protein product [Caenorhabditis auriculariae]